MRAPEVLVEESGHHRGHLLDGLAHGGQRRTAGRRRAGVVEADDGDVVRHPSAPFPQHLTHPLGHQVVGREHPVHVGVFGQQSGHRGHAAVERESALGDGYVRMSPARHRVAEPGEPVLAGVDAQWPRDGDDPSAAPVQQMVGGHPGAVPVGQVDIAERHRARRPGEEHRGQASVGEQRRQRVVGVGGDDERAVRAALPQIVQRLLSRLRGVGEHQQRVHRPGTQVVHHAGDDQAEERVRQHPCREGVPLLAGDVARAGDDERDRLGPSCHQRPGGPVGSVSGPFDGLADRVLKGGIDALDAVDDAGDGGAGHAGLPRDVLKRGGPSAHVSSLSARRHEGIERSLAPRHRGVPTLVSAPLERNHPQPREPRWSPDITELPQNIRLLTSHRETIHGTRVTTLDAVFTRMKHASARERSPHLQPFTF